MAHIIRYQYDWIFKNLQLFQFKAKVNYYELHTVELRRTRCYFIIAMFLILGEMVLCNTSNWMDDDKESESDDRRIINKIK